MAEIRIEEGILRDTGASDAQQTARVGEIMQFESMRQRAAATGNVAVSGAAQESPIPDTNRRLADARIMSDPTAIKPEVSG